MNEKEKQAMRQTKAAAAAKLLDPDIMEAHAQVILNHVASLDPLWAERVRITQQERGFSAMQVLSAWLGHVLDSGSHMLFPPHKYFDTGFKGAGARTNCEGCGKDFAVTFAGQRYCSDTCWETYCQEGTREVMRDRHVDQQLAELKETDPAELTD